MVQNISTIDIFSPAQNKVVGHVNETKLEEVSSFYEKSRQVFNSWKELSFQERAVYFNKLKSIMIEKMEETSSVVAKDTGKVLTEAVTADIMPTIDAIAHMLKHGEEILKTQKASTPLLLFTKKSFIEYMPRGVVLVISPWNYPLQLAMVPMLSALFSGNSVILKPSEVTPLVGKHIEELFALAGFPEGVVQVAHGGKEVGAAFTQGKPDYIFFTGSVRTGKIISEIAARDLIPTTLELGGKDPMVVFEDANLKRAVKGAVWAAFTNSGQVCMSAERIYVERSVYAHFVELVKKEVAALKQGDHKDDDIGSMTFPGQIDIIKAQLEEALNKGAVIEVGTTVDQLGKDMFIRPTVLTNVHHHMKIVQEESFGPLMPIIPFDNEEEAIQYANDSIYGLNASVWTKDLQKARRVASKIVSGAVVINDALISAANHGLPFGGTKQSGLGRYHGETGLRIFCHEKAIMVDSGVRNSEIQWYPYKGKYELFVSLFKSYFKNQRNWPSFIKEYFRLLKK